MLTTIGLVIASIAGAITLYNHWDEFKSWMADFVETVKTLFETLFKGVAHATGIFIRILRNGVAEVIHKTYVPLENEDELGGEITTRKVTRIPRWAQMEIEREQEAGREVKLSREMARRLGLVI